MRSNEAGSPQESLPKLDRMLVWLAFAAAFSPVLVDWAQALSSEPYGWSALLAPALLARLILRGRGVPRTAASASHAMGAAFIGAGLLLEVVGVAADSWSIARFGAPIAFIGCAYWTGRPAPSDALMALWSVPLPSFLYHLTSPQAESLYAKWVATALSGVADGITSRGPLLNYGDASLEIFAPQSGAHIAFLMAGIGFYAARLHGIAPGTALLRAGLLTLLAPFIQAGIALLAGAAFVAGHANLAGLVSSTFGWVIVALIGVGYAEWSARSRATPDPPEPRLAPVAPTHATASVAKPGASVGERDALDRTLARGIAWTGGVRWASQILNWIATIVVARLLSPEDYGFVGMATVFFGFVMLVNEFGLGSSIVVVRDLDRQQIARLNSLALLFGITCFAGSFAAAGPIASFYGAPEVRAIVIWMSLTFLVTAFRTVPNGLLEKELRFKEMALIEGTQGITRSGVTLAMAWLGYGYWSLVGGAVSAAVVSTAGVLLVRVHPFARPAPVGEALRVSWHILISRLSWFTYSNADFLVAGKVLGATALGYYTIAFTLASIPVDRITAMVAKVTPAVLAAAGGDRAELRRYFLSLTGGLALVTVPVAWGLAAVAEEFVLLVLDDKWQGAILVLRLLAFYAAVRCITPLLSHVLLVTGHTRFSMWLGALSAIVLPVGFVLASRYGIVGIASVWLVLHPMLILPSYVKVFRVLSLPASDYIVALWPAVSSGAAMLATVFAVRSSLDLTPGLLLPIETVAGAAAYLGTLGLLHRQRLRDALDTLRLLRTA